MVPEEAYSSSYLREEPLDKSYDFISQCAHPRLPGSGGQGLSGLGVAVCRGVAGWAARLTSSFPPAPPAHLPLPQRPPPPSHSSTTMGSMQGLPRGGRP